MAKIPRQRAHRSPVAFVLLGIAFAGSFGPGLVSRASERRKRDLPVAEVVSARSSTLAEAARQVQQGEPAALAQTELSKNSKHDAPAPISKGHARTTFSLRNEGDVLVTVRMPGGRDARLAPTESVRVAIEPGAAPAVRLVGGGFSTELAPKDGASYVVQRIGDALVVRRAGSGSN
jgi:hypothetical protein